jgi:RNA polymerase-binding transcription factor DksA
MSKFVERVRDWQSQLVRAREMRGTFMIDQLAEDFKRKLEAEAVDGASIELADAREVLERILEGKDVSCEACTRIRAAIGALGDKELDE